MILTQTYKDACLENVEPVGTYYDEIELTTVPGYGLNKQAHIDELQKRANDLIVLGAIFSSRQGSAHPNYGRIVVSVTGDLYKRFGLDKNKF